MATHSLHGIRKKFCNDRFNASVSVEHRKRIHRHGFPLSLAVATHVLFVVRAYLQTHNHRSRKQNHRSPAFATHMCVCIIYSFGLKRDALGEWLSLPTYRHTDTHSSVGPMRQHVERLRSAHRRIYKIIDTSNRGRRYKRPSRKDSIFLGPSSFISLSHARRCCHLRLINLITALCRDAVAMSQASG